MEAAREQSICGFVPPYILEAIAASDNVAEESRIACQHTLKHTNAYHEQRHELCTEGHVSSPPIGTGFIPEYILEAIADPKKGSIEEQRSNQQTPLTAEAELATSVQRKIYDCKATGRRPGTLVRSEGQARIQDRQVNNCYDGFKITHDFYSRVFDRNSLDGKGLPLIGSVHYKPSEAPAGYNNAFWDGGANQMVFGDGDHIMFDYLTDSLDVIAHELSHGFVQYSSPLDYVSQSGALNESCADVFGSMVEQWHMRQTVDDADWILGQTLFPVAFTGSALRSLKAGKAYTDDPVFGTDPQPKHMKDIYTGPNDRGGVHINSGIPSHAFYLAAKALGGNSWEKAGKVWYKTMLSGKIPVDCDFKTFAKVTVDIAGDEFADESVQNGIRDAWVKVGVLGEAGAE
ncbi:Nn.00g081170.m01.CDS01 [Neocucurbitaria sp. VM-36]